MNNYENKDFDKNFCPYNEKCDRKNNCLKWRKFRPMYENTRKMRFHSVSKKDYKEKLKTEEEKFYENLEEKYSPEIVSIIKREIFNYKRNKNHYEDKHLFKRKSNLHYNQDTKNRERPKCVM